MSDGRATFEVTVDNKAGKVLTAIQGQFSKTTTGVTGASAAMSNSVDGLWKKIAQGAVVVAAVRKVQEAVTSVFSETIKYDAALANVSTLVDTSAVSMKDYESKILNLAGALGSATELTEALYQALSAGVDPARGIQLVADSAKFAKAALTDTFTAVDAITTAINAYGYEAKDATYISDIFFQTVKQGKITGQELASDIGRMIPAFAALDIPLTQAAAGLATLTKGGIKSAEAVTALNSTLMAVLKPSQQASEVAAQLHIDFSRAGIQGAGGFQQWLAMLKKEIGNNERAMAALFPNVRGLKAVFALTGNQAGEFSRILKEMEKASGSVEEAFKKQQTTIKASMDTVKNRIEATMIKVLLPVLRDVAKWLVTNQVQFTLMAKQFIVGVVDVAKTIKALIPVVKIFGIILATSFAMNKVTAFATGLRGIAAQLGAFPRIAAGLGKIGTVLGSLGPLAIAFTTAFTLTSEILEVLGLNEAISNFSQEMMEAIGIIRTAEDVTTKHAKTNAFFTAQVREAGKKLGVQSTSLKEISVEIIKHDKVYRTLTGSAQLLVDKMAAQAGVTRKTVKESKEKAKQDYLNKKINEQVADSTDAVSFSLDKQEKATKKINYTTDIFINKLMELDKKGVPLATLIEEELAGSIETLSDKFEANQRLVKTTTDIVTASWRRHRKEIISNAEASRRMVAALDQIGFGFLKFEGHSDGIAKTMKGFSEQTNLMSIAMRGVPNIGPVFDSIAKSFDGIKFKDTKEISAELVKEIVKLKAEFDDLDRVMRNFSDLTGLFSNMASALADIGFVSEKTAKRVGMLSSSLNNVGGSVAALTKLSAVFSTLGTISFTGLVQVFSNLPSLVSGVVNLIQLVFNTGLSQAQLARRAVEAFGDSHRLTADQIRALSSAMAAAGVTTYAEAVKFAKEWLGELSNATNITADTIAKLAEQMLFSGVTMQDVASGKADQYIKTFMELNGITGLSIEDMRALFVELIKQGATLEILAEGGMSDYIRQWMETLNLLDKVTKQTKTLNELIREQNKLLRDSPGFEGDGGGLKTKPKPGQTPPDQGAGPGGGLPPGFNPGGGIPGFAEGTRGFQSTESRFVVGENAPELVEMSADRSRMKISPLSSDSGASRNGQQIVNITINVISSPGESQDDLAAKIKRMFVENTRDITGTITDYIKDRL